MSDSHEDLVREQHIASSAIVLERMNTNSLLLHNMFGEGTSTYYQEN